MSAEPEPVRVVTLRIPARAEHLVFCRLALAGLARVRGIDAETVSDLKLAVTEACSQAILRSPDGAGVVSVRFALAPDAVEVEVEDAHAGGGGGAADAGGDADELGEPALGLAIIEALSDEVESLPARDGHALRLRLRKRLP